MAKEPEKKLSPIENIKRIKEIQLDKLNKEKEALEIQRKKIEEALRKQEEETKNQINAAAAESIKDIINKFQRLSNDIKALQEVGVDVLQDGGLQGILTECGLTIISKVKGRPAGTGEGKKASSSKLGKLIVAKMKELNRETDAAGMREALGPKKLGGEPYNRQSIYLTMSKLTAEGILNNDGGTFSLKSLD